MSGRLSDLHEIPLELEWPPVPGSFVKDDRGVCFYEVLEVTSEHAVLKEIAAGRSRVCEYGRIYRHPLKGCSAIVLEPWQPPRTRFDRVVG